MINTISYFSLDSFEGVKPAAGDPAEFAIASGFAALMNLPVPVNVPIKAVSPEDPVEISAFSTTDPDAGGNEGQTGKFFPNQSEAQGAVAPQTGANTSPDTPPADLCWDGTSWTPNPKKDFGLDILSNRRQITDTAAIPVRLPPHENPPSNDTPRDPRKKEDFGIQVISGGRPIVDPTAIPVKLPPVEPVSTTKPDVKSTPIKLPPRDALWDDGGARDPKGKKDFSLGVFNHQRPIVNPAVIPVKLPPQENAPVNDTLTGPVKTSDPGLQIMSDQRPIVDPAVNPVKLPSEEPVPTTKPEIKSAPIKTSPGSNAPVKLPPHDALWDDGSTRDPKEMKKFNLGIFDRLRSITGVEPSVDQAVPATVSRAADPEKAGAAIGANKWLDPKLAQPVVQSPVDIAQTTPEVPANDIEPIMPATIGEFHLPEDVESGPGTPEIPVETAPDQAITVTPGAKPTPEETPLLVRPRHVIDAAAIPVKLPSEEPLPTTRPDIKSAPIGDIPSPVKLPPRDALWDDGSTRGNEMKKFNLGIFNRHRSVSNTEPRAGLPADLTDVATIQIEPVNPEATVRANKWLEQLTGQKLPQQPLANSAGPAKEIPADEVEPGPPVLLDELQMPENVKRAPGSQEGTFKTAGNSDQKVLAAVDLNPEEKPLLVRPRPIVDPVAEVEKPLLRQPFQPVKTNGTGNVENEDHRANLAQLFREVSNSFESAANQKAPIGQPGTLKSMVAGTNDIINEIGGYLTEVEIAPETEIKADAGDPIAAQFDKFWQPEPIGNKELKMDAGALTLQDAQEILDQVKPGLLELAALTAKKNEKQSMKMRLHPAELGAVEISLERNSSGALSAHFRTENEGARQALTNNLDQLRDSLQKSGWQVGQLDVSSNPSSSTADQNREHGSRQNEVVGDNFFDHRSDKPEDLEQDSSSRLLNLRA